MQNYVRVWKLMNDSQIGSERLLPADKQDELYDAIQTRQSIRRAIFVGKFKAIPHTFSNGEGRASVVISRSIRREMARLAALAEWRKRQKHAATG